MIWQYLLNGLLNGCGYMLIALGMSMVMGILGVVNTAHATLYTIGCYVLYTCTKLWGISFIPSVLIAMLAIALLSFAIEKLVFKKLRTKDHVMQLIVSSGLTIFFVDAIRIIWTANSIRITTPFAGKVFEIGSVTVSLQRLTLLAAAVIAVVFILTLLKKTKFGLMMRALPQDNLAATLNGINVNMVSAITFAIAGAMVVLGSATLAPLYTVTPNIGDAYGNKIFIIIALGGIGSIEGTILGAILVGMIEVLITAYIMPGMENVVVFGILVLTLLIKPTGMFGRKQLA